MHRYALFCSARAWERCLRHARASTESTMLEPQLKSEAGNGTEELFPRLCSTSCHGEAAILELSIDLLLSASFKRFERSTRRSLLAHRYAFSSVNGIYARFALLWQARDLTARRHLVRALFSFSAKPDGLTLGSCARLRRSPQEPRYLPRTIECVENDASIACLPGLTHGSGRCRVRSHWLVRASVRTSHRRTARRRTLSSGRCASSLALAALAQCSHRTDVRRSSSELFSVLHLLGRLHTGLDCHFFTVFSTCMVVPLFPSLSIQAFLINVRLHLGDEHPLKRWLVASLHRVSDLG